MGARGRRQPSAPSVAAPAESEIDNEVNERVSHTQLFCDSLRAPLCARPPSAPTRNNDHCTTVHTQHSALCAHARRVSVSQHARASHTHTPHADHLHRAAPIASAPLLPAASRGRRQAALRRAARHIAPHAQSIPQSSSIAWPACCLAPYQIAAARHKARRRHSVTHLPCERRCCVRLKANPPPLCVS